MRKLYSFVIFLLLGTLIAQAAPVDAAKAGKVADRYVRLSGLYDKTQKVNRVVDITSQTSYTAFYVFRIEGTRCGKGFVLVSADDCARPVLGYSFESDFEVEGMPEHVAAWLQGYENEILAAREAGVGTNALWDRLLNSGQERLENAVVVNALLSTRWSQSPRYNNLCPYDSTDNERTVTGCVATAMGQIMRYWNYPTHGIGSHSYTHSLYGTQSANFAATNYDWANMPVQLTSSSSTTQINAVATLLYHCGVAVNMDYGTSTVGGSAATTVGNTPGAATAENAFKNYFDYATTLQGVSRNAYSDIAWKQLLMNELNASRPMMYRGSGNNGGHAFVCDGYDSDTNFHFNWGWSGSYNGFFAVTALTPSGYSFTDGQQALIGIYPANSAGLSPRDLRASHIANNSATLTWTDRNMASGTTFLVAYGPAATFDTASSSTYSQRTVTGESLALTGLTANTSYKAAVRIAGSGNGLYWSNIVTFSTIGAPQTAPSLVGFESGIPAGWSQEYVTGEIAWTTANGGHASNPASALTGSRNALLWTGAIGSTTILVTPMLNLTGGDNADRSGNTTHKMAFGHAQVDWSGDIDMLNVYYRTSPSAEWTALASYPQEIASWQRDTLTLPNPSGTYQVGFQGELHWGYGVCLDDVSFLTETEVNDSIVVSDVILACDSYTVTDNNGTRTFTQTGTYRLVYTAVSGIDSIILRTVVIGHPTHNSTTVTEIGRYIWHDVIYTESGTYTYNYTNNYGCACADTLHLTIVPCTTEYRNQYVEACDEYTWSNYVTYYESTNEAYDTLTVDGGCPLIMRLNLTIYHSTHNNYSATAMNTYTWHDSLYFETGAFPYHYNDVHNCPSADTLHLTITPAPAVVVDSLHPYHENFEGDFTWYLQSGTAVNRWAYGTATANGGTHALYISNDRGHTNHYDITKRSIAYASKLFTLGRGTHYIGYDWKCYGENNYDYLRVFLAPASAHFNGDSLPSGNPTAATNTYLHTVPDGWITLDDSSKLNMQSNWQSFTAEANVTTPGDYRLVFLWIDDASVGTDPPAAIDDISIELVNCGRPSNLAVNNIHTNTATVSWIGTGTQYQVAYGTGTDPDQMTLLTSSDSTVTLTGLSGGTTYHVYVRNVCSPTLHSAWSGMVTFSTPYPPVVVDETHPFSDGFEGPCTWWLVNGDRTNRWYWGTAASNGGSHSIYISNNSGNNNTYNNGITGVTYATKLFALKSGTYHVAYDWRAKGERTAGGTDYDYLRVFLAPGNTTITAGTTLPNGTTSTPNFANVTPDGWISVDSSHCLNTKDTWQHFEGDVDIPDSGNYVLMYVWITDGSAGDNPPAAVDNVNITRPSCAAPSNIHIASIFSSSATLAWVGNGNNYRVAYGLGTNPDQLTQVNVTGMSHTLTNLSPNTIYHAFVRGICDNNIPTAWVGPIEIATPCVPYTITTSNSLTENFENNMPGCWRAIYPCSNNAISISTGSTYNSSHSLRFSSYNSCSDGYYQYFISQEIACAAPMQLSVHYRDYNTNNHLWIGYSTTGNSPEHFTTWREMPNSASEWLTFNDEVPMGTKFVAFRYYGNHSYYSYIDDIELRWARYQITAVSSNTAQGTVSGSSTRNYNATATIRAFPTACYQFSHWNDGNTANPRTVTVTQDSTFTAYFTTATLTGNDTVAACGSYLWGTTTYTSSGTYTRHVTTTAGCDSVATLHLTINHGTHNVVYDTTSSIPYIWHDSTYTAAGVYLYNYTNAAGCASTDTLYLEISNPCPALSTLPYTENFDTLSNGNSETFVPCWHRVSYAYSITAAYPFVASVGRNNTIGLYWSHATNATDYEYVALPAIDTTLHPIRTLKLTFWARATSNQPRIEVGVMSDPEDTNTFVPVRLLSIESSTWTSRTTYFNNYNGHGQYLALRGRSSNANWSACLDDFTIDVAPACIEPVDIVALTTTATTATLSWQGSAQSYSIAYGTGNNPAVMDSVSSNSNSVTLSGLTANTEYHVFGRSYCSNGQHSGWSEMYTFHTECASITTLPYSEGFENANTGSLTAPNFTVECWKRFTNGTTYYAPFVSTIRHAGSKGLSWTLYNGETYGTSHFVVLPGIEVPNRTLNALRVSFWGRVNTAAGQCPFQVGVMTDINDTNTFTPVSTVMVTGNTWTEYTIDLAPYTGTGIYIALRNLTPASYLVAYTDDFTVSVAPTCFPPDSVIFSNITSHSATATWSANAGSYVVAYGTGTNPDAMDSLVVTSGTATLVNLTSNTDYHVFVRSVCNDERSVWSAMYTFHTECGINALPFTDGFESYSAGSVSNATFTASCWTRHNNASSYHVPFVGTTGRTTTRGITWNMNGTVPYGTSHYLVLPAVEVPGQVVNTLQLTFWARCYSNNYTNHFQVGVMTDRNDTNTFTPVSDVTINSGSWTEFTTYLIPYTGTGKYIALRSRNVSNGNNVFFDDFTVSLAPTCFPPTGITVSGITANSATVAWTGTAGTYKVAYGTGTNPDAMDYVTVTGSSTTLTGLTPMTDYNVYLQSVCPDTHSFWSEATTFTTACGRIIAFPFTEDFEGHPTGSTSTANADFGVPCWTHINNGSIYTGSPYIFYSQHHSGTQSLWWQMANYNNAQWPSYQMLVLPGVDNTIDLRELRLTCWIGSTSNLNANSIFYVGVMTDPNNVNTFTQVATVPLESSSWQEYHVDFNNYNGNGKYIALRTVRSNAFWGASMDDVTLDYIPPTVIDTVAVACDSFTWNNTTYYTSGNYTRPHTEHNITVYDTLHLTINHGTHNVEYDTAEVSYTWHGTTYNTTGVYTYNYTNTEGCASTDTLYLEIIDPYAPVLVDETHPFFDGFENGDRWQKYHGELPNKWYVGTATSRDGDNALYVSNNNGTSNTYTITSPVAIFAAKSFILPAGHYYFSYDWKGYGESTYDFLRVALAPASALLTPGTNGYSGFTNTQVPSGWISLDGNQRKNQSSTWQTYTAEANITTAGIYQMVFYWRNDNSVGTQPPAGVDNVNILKTNCVRPTNVAASNITGTTATLTWNGTASSYQVAYGTMESINEMTMQTANGTTLQLSGLSPSNNYNVYVRAICASEQSPWSNIYSFTTNCGALTALPYMQGFEESTSGSSTSFNVNCWSRYTSSGNYPYVTNSSSIAHTGSKSLYWYSSSTYTQYIVMPEVETAILPINSLRLKFWTKTSSTSTHPTLVVGVMTNPTDISTFAPIQSIDCSGNTDYREHIINLNSYTGTGRYIAIRAQANSGSWTVYVDDFTLEAMPSCPEPTNITTIATTTTTATVAWTGMNANSYTVAYGTGTNPNSMDTVRVNAAMATLTGLSASTEYHLYVRANCSGEHSNWSALHTFRTQCGLITDLPYTENINSATTSSSVFDVPCWQRLASSNYPYATTTAGRSGAGLTWYCPNTAGTYQFAILPAIDTTLHPMRTLKLTFWARSSSTSYQPRIQVGVMSNTTDTHTFTPIQTIDLTGTTWTEQTVYFNSYHGTGMNIAVRGVRTSSTWYGYLDDFTVDVAPQCIEPMGVTATNITTTGAHLSWTGAAPSYTVAYGTGVDPASMTTVSANTTSINLTGLTPNTVYNVFVKSICSPGLESSWSEIITFRTECNAITTLPYNEGFEGYPITSNIMPDFAVDCWKRHTNGTTTYIPYIYAIAHTGNRGLFWSLNYSASYGSLQTVVLPSFEVPGQAVNTLQLTFWARGSAASATGTFQVGVMTDPYDTTTFTPISTLTVTGSTWMEYTTLLNTYNGTGTYIALRHNNSGNNDVGSAYFDDFSVTVAPTCDTVIPVVTTLAACESYTWHGQTYTATGLYTFDTLVGTCTRTDTLHLTINHGTHNAITSTSCESYTWHGQAYTATGVYTYNYTNGDGCASTDTLHLTIYHGTHNSFSETACESYTWHGTTYTASGTPVYTYTNANGCASADTLHLTINYGTHNSFAETVDESYTWQGTTYTATGVYTYNYTNAAGCASTDTLHLTVDPYMPILVNETHPFNDGFERAILHWQVANGSQTNKWYQGTAAHSNGDKALYISNDNGNTNAYNNLSASTVFATKQFILPAGHFYFSYDWRANGENNYDYMRVYLTPATATVTAGTLPNGVSTTGTPNGWVTLDRGRQMNMSTDWSNYTAEVNITDSAIYQVVFLWYNDSYVGENPPAGIDEVTFIKSDCYSPTGIAASNITDATATLSWTGNATSYMVVYGTSTAIGDMDTVVVAGNTTTLTGLAHTTTHYVYVKSICSATDFSAWSAVYSFRTACGAIALPYSYGIDDPSTAYYNTTLAECWTAGNSGDNANNDPSVSTYYAHDGALSLYMTSSNAYYSYVVLPRFDNPVNRTQMTFWGRAANNSNLSTVEIGVVNSPSDMSSFVLVDTAYFLNSGVLNWHEKEVVFDTYTGNGQYIAIRLPNTGNFRCYLDDFTVEAMPECSGVWDLAVSATTDSSVTLSWRETGSATSWSVEYGPQGFLQGSGTMTTVNATTITITGLTNNTWYDFYVHSDCVHATSRVQSISAQTDCGRMAIPFLEDFNGYAGSYSDSPIDRCWYKCYSPNNNQTSYPQFTYNSSDNSNIFLSFTSTRNYYSYLVLPYMQGNIHDQMLRFKVRTTGGNSADIQVGVMTNATNFNTFQQVQQLTRNTNSNWVTVNVPFNNLNGSNYRIAIVSPRLQGGGNQAQSFYVDDIEVIPIPDCNAPANVNVTGITTTSATLSWTAATGISRYRVVYMPHGDYDSTYRVTVDSLTATTLPLTGLQMGTTYDVEVYSLCVTGSLSAPATTTFSTTCSPHGVPFTENFDHCIGTLVSPCWNNGFYGSSTASYPVVSTGTPKYDGDKALLFWSSSQTMYSYAVLPTLDDTLSLLQISLQTRISGTNQPASFQIGTVASSGNISSFQTLQSITATDTWQQHTVSFSSVNNNTRRIALRYQPTGGGGPVSNIFVDDIIVDRIPACNGPARLTADRIVYNGARLHWPATAGIASYTIEYGPSGFTLGQGTQVSGLTDTSYTLTGLNPGTAYTAYLVATCNSGNQSSLVSTSFSTGCLEELPYIYGFEGLTTSPTGTVTTVPCWVLNENTSVQSGQYTTGYAAEGISRMRFSVSQATAYAVMPKLDDSINHLYMTLQVNTGTTYFDEPLAPLYVGVVTDPYDFSTFLPVDTLLPTASNTWQSFRVDFNSLTDNDYYIAFYGTGSYFTSYVYLDDIHVYLIAPYNIDLTVADPVRGTVSINGVTATHGQALAGSNVTLSATANHGYTFSHWAAGVTENPYTFVMPDHDVAYNHIVFSLNTYDVTVLANDSTLGSVTGTGRYDYLDTAILTATPNGIHTFLRWSDGVTVNPRSLVVTDDTTITAIFQNNCPAGADTTVIACDSYLWHGTAYTASGLYTYQPYPGICPAADTLRLTVNNSVSVIDTQTACESYRWINGVTYTASTNTPTVTLTNTEGCDSTVTLNLTINYHSTENIYRTTCDSTTFHGNTYYYSGTYYFDTVNEEGCDHLIALNLTLHYGTHDNYYQNSCGNYSWNGTTYTATGTYTYNYTNSDGCASTDTLHLVIDQHADTAYHVTACDSYRWNDSLYTQTGVYTYNYSLAGSTCTNVDTLYLTVNHSAAVTLIDTACDSYTWHDSTYVYPYPSGYTYPYTSVYTYATTTAAGCDSVETLNLTLKRSTTGADIVTACDSYTWIDGNAYTASTITPTHTLTAANGCDSVVTLFLTVNHSSTTNETIVACDSYTWHGRTRTVTGVYTFDTVNVAGCDSTVTLNLTVNHGTTSSMTAAACDSYTWHDSTYTATGVYTFDTLGANGCNNTETLTLTVYYGTYNNYYDTAELHYTWHGTTYDTTGDYTYTYANADGCPSTDTLHLVIDPMRPVLVDETHPFFDYFEEGCRWNFTNGEYPNRWYYGTAANHGGTHSIYISDDGGATNSYTIVNNNSRAYATKLFILPQGTFSFNYDWRATGELNFDYMLVCLAPATDTLPATILRNYRPVNWISLDGNGQHAGVTSWHTYSTTVTIADSGVYRMIFYWQNDGVDGSNPPAAVDNVHIVKTSCLPATEIAVRGIPSTTEATLYWTGNGTHYTVAYGTATSPSDMDTLVVTDTTVTLTNLNPSTEYHLFVRTWCSQTQTSVWSEMFSFRTSCGGLAQLPYYEDFEGSWVLGQETNEFYANNCWNYVGDRPLIGSSNVQSHSGRNFLLLHPTTTSNSTYIILPQINTDSLNINSLYLSLWARIMITYPDGVISTQKLVVGIMDNDTNSFVPVDTIEVQYIPNPSDSRVWYEKGIDFSPYHGTGSFIALHPINPSTDIPGGNLTILLDDFTIDHMPQPIDTTVVACDSFTWGDTTYTTSGIHTRLRLFHGITLYDTIRLTIHPSTTGVDVVDACDSLTWIDGVTYRVSTSLPTYTVTDIHGCDSVVTLNLTIHHPSTGTDVVTACDRFTWVNGITYTANNYGSTYTLTNAGGCDSTLTLDLTIHHSTTGSESVTVCDSYTWHGILHDDSGVFTFDTTNAAGCDSTATLTLTVNHRTTGTETVTACDQYTWLGTTYYRDTTLNSQLSILNSQGCDTTVILTLTIHHSTTGSETVTACDQYTWQGTTYYHDTTLNAQLSILNSEGCDSTVTLDLTINYSTTGSETVTACDQYTWLGTTYYQDTTLNSQLSILNSQGCDSTVTLHLTIHHGTHDIYHQHACDSYTWHGTAYTVTGTYLYEYTNGHGCESVDTLFLTVDQHSDTAYHVDLCDTVYRWNDSVYTSSGIYIYDYRLAGSSCTNVDTLYLNLHDAYSIHLWDTACDQYFWPGTVIPEGDWYRESGTYTRNLHTVHGCDSVSTLHLTIHHSSTLDTTILACDTLLWFAGADTIVITESGDYTVLNVYTWTDINPSIFVLDHPLYNAQGCDSTQLLHVTINHSTTAIENVTACDSYTWLGTTYYSDTTLNSQLSILNSQGCDSLVNLTLTLHHSTTDTHTVVTCDQYTWLDGVTYYRDTTLNSQLSTLNSQGCDSIALLQLTLHYGLYTSTYQAACDDYLWHDSLYTLSGTYLWRDSTADGCPVVDTLILTVSNGTSAGYHVDACDRYVWNGTEYTLSGNYIYDYSTLGGDCENVDTLYLTLHYSSYDELFDTVCDSYLFGGELITVGGDYREQLTSIHGCDSVTLLHLTLHYNTSTAFTDSLPDGGSYTWHGQTYTSAGTYYYDYLSPDGCPSTDTLYLLAPPVPVYYTIHARSADNTLGYTIVYPDSVLLSGALAFVVAVPHEGYRFSHWDDGDTSVSRIFHITSDTAFTAYFEEYVGIDKVDAPAFRLWSEGKEIYIEGNAIAGMPVVAYDLQGRVLYNLKADADRLTIDAARWAAGVYLVRIGLMPAQRVILR